MTVRTQQSMLIYFSLTVPLDTGIVTAAPLCYLFSNHASRVFFLSLNTFYDFIFITHMSLFICDLCFFVENLARYSRPLILFVDFVLATVTGEFVQDVKTPFFHTVKCYSVGEKKLCKQNLKTGYMFSFFCFNK